MTTDDKSLQPPAPLDKPVFLILDGQLLEALNDYREKKVAMRSASPDQKTSKQSEYIAASERLALTLDHSARPKTDLDSLGYSPEQSAQIKDHNSEITAQISGVAYTLPKRT